MQTAMEKPPKHLEEEGGEDHTSKLPDDILVEILSLCRYRYAVRAASVSRRWERLVAQLPDLCLCLSEPIGTPCERRVRSLARTLRRRCRDGTTHAVRTLQLLYRNDVPMECRHADEFIALAGARKLLLCVDHEPPDDHMYRGDDAGAWSLLLPPATEELRVTLFWYAVPPHIHGSGVSTLRSLVLEGFTVLRQDFLLTGLPSLEDLHIGKFTIPASIEITSAAMPRLKHLAMTDVRLMTEETRAAISVLADELRTLRMSCHLRSKTEPPSEREMFDATSRFGAMFTSYSCFRLRAPRLRALEWRCCYADEVRIESVGRLSEVAVEIAAGRMRRRFDQERRYVTTQQRDKLMTDILEGLMPGLQPRSWEDVKRKCRRGGRDDRWLCFEITSACSVAECTK